MKTICFALFLGLLGCAKKEELPECPGSCTVVTGRLLTSGLNPLANATVTLEWVGGSAYAPKACKKAVTTTDANGHYRVSGFLSDAELAGGFIQAVFSPDKSKYYTIGEPAAAFYRPKRDTVYTAQDFLIPRKATITFVVTNPGQIPASNYYSINVRFSYGYNVVFNSNTSNDGISTDLSASNASSTIDIPGGQSIVVEQRKNGTYPFPQDIITVPAGTALTYPLTY